MRIVSNSQLQKVTRCKLQWGFRYLTRLKPREISKPASIGLLVHKALAMLYQTGTVYWNWIHLRASLRDAGDWGDMVQEAKRLIDGYLEEYGPPEKDLISLGESLLAVEWPFRVSIRTPKGTRSNYQIVGRMDMVTRGRGGIWIWEHKTFKSRTSTPGFDDMDAQVNTYAWAAHRLGLPIAGVVINRIQRTKIPRLDRVRLIKGLKALEEWDSVLYAQCRSLPSMGAKLSTLPRTLDRSCTWCCPYFDVCRLMLQGEMEGAWSIIDTDYDIAVGDHYGREHLNDYNNKAPRDWLK